MPRTYLAIDIGGSKLTAGIVDDDGVVLVRDRVATPPRDVWPTVQRLVLRVLAAAPELPVACGAGCSGPMDPIGRTVSPLTIPTWDAFELAAELEQLTQLPTVVDNDAKAFALAEAWCGAARGRRDFIGVVMGSAVSGGIVSRGTLVQGRLGNAGNIGHIIVEPDGRQCVCGAAGCLDAYCGGLALTRETGRPPQRVPPAIVERTGLLLGRALAMVGVVCDVPLAVVGGSVALGFGESFFTSVADELSRRARLPYIAGMRVERAHLGASAPLIGAAALAREVAPAASRGWR
jgi:glucokinase